MYFRFQKLMGNFLLFIFALILIGMNSKASYAKDSGNIIKELAKVEFMIIDHAEEEDEDESDEEEERF